MGLGGAIRFGAFENGGGVGDCGDAAAIADDFSVGGQRLGKADGKDFHGLFGEGIDIGIGRGTLGMEGSLGRLRDMSSGSRHASMKSEKRTWTSKTKLQFGLVQGKVSMKGGTFRTWPQLHLMVGKGARSQGT